VVKDHLTLLDRDAPLLVPLLSLYKVQAFYTEAVFHFHAVVSSVDGVPELSEQDTYEPWVFFGKEQLSPRDHRNFRKATEVRAKPGERRRHVEYRIGIAPDDLRGNL